MRAILTNFGSLGDIQPFIALALELQRHRHQPTLALAPYYARYIKHLGLPFAPLGPDLDYPELQRAEMHAVTQGSNPLDKLREFIPLISSMLPRMFDELIELCRTSDVLISGHLQPLSRMIHDLTQIALVSVQTNHFGGKQANLIGQAFASVINPFRAELGFPPVGGQGDESLASPQLAIYAMSRYFRRRDPSWPEHYHVTGFFFMEHEGWEPPPALSRFLDEGEPPVVFTFSSVALENPIAMTDLLLEAIRIGGCRAIIQRGWSGLAEGHLLPGVLAVDFVQHTWLFPRAACVIHAGGSGTTAATIRAGIPSIVIPFTSDQPIWAELARQAGCAAFVIPHAQLTAERLGEAIAETLSSDCYSHTAAEFGAQIRSESGVKKARVLIEQLVNKIGLRSDEASPALQIPSLYGNRDKKTDRRKHYQLSRRIKKRGQGESG